MYKVFSNQRVLWKLNKNVKKEELVAEFEKAFLVQRPNCEGAITGAGEMYRIMCDTLKEDHNTELFTRLNAHAVELFSAEWDVDSLLMIEGNPARFGKLTETAKQVLAEYEKARKLAISEVEKRHKAYEWSHPCGEFIAKYKNGALSLERGEDSYLVFFTE